MGLPEQVARSSMISEADLQFYVSRFKDRGFRWSKDASQLKNESRVTEKRSRVTFRTSNIQEIS